VHILLYSPDSEHAAAVAAALRDSGDDEVEVLDSLAGLNAQVASIENLDGVVIAYDDPILMEVIDNILECHSRARIVLLMPMARIPSLVGCRPNTGVLPLPGTGLALRVALSADPANDPTCRIGDFQLLGLSALGERTHVFDAMQRSIERPVTLHMLNDEWFEAGHVRDSFLGDVRAKAMVTHEDVASVYQALEADGQLFYTEEALNGDSLAEIAASGRGIDAMRTLQVVRAVAGTLSHFKRLELGCHGISLRHVFLPEGAGQHARLANQADSKPPETGVHEKIFQGFLEELVPVIDLDAPGASDTLRWIGELQSGDLRLDEIVRQARSRVVMVEEDSVDGEVPAVAPGGKSLMGMNVLTASIVGVVVVAAVILAGGLVLRSGNGESAPKVAEIDLVEGRMISVSGGDFEHPERGSVTVEPFEIDEFEVTIHQYAEFLAALEEEPDKVVGHPDQPAGKTSYKPDDWDNFYRAALSSSTYMGQPITVNMPVFNVDWWDAYAFASWLGRRLPTSLEWELAARGPEWHPYPWGEEWDPAMLNSGEDFPDPNTEVEPGSIDGYVYWAPVDEPAGDVSPKGVRGMGGNVSEWTASEAVAADDPNLTVAVVKGGSFMRGSSFDMARDRHIAHDERSFDIGFRTARNNEPTDQQPDSP